jgi:hypothetical protein
MARPGCFLPAGGQVRQQFHHGPPAGDRGGHRLDPGVLLGQPGFVLADELPQVSVAADLTGPGVVDDHLPGPHGLQRAGVTVVQRGEVLPDRISLG